MVGGPSQRRLPPDEAASTGAEGSALSARLADLICLALPCGLPCGTGPLGGRYAAAHLRSARSRCRKLRKQGPDAPLAHLRAAEQHLGAVEMWLRGGHSSASVRRRGSLVQIEAESFAEVALEFGRCSEEEERSFCALFDVRSPDEDDADDISVVAEERLLAKFPGSVLASAFFHQGHMYLSSERFCFHSCVMGLEIKFSTPWSNLKGFLLASSKEGGGDGSGIRGLRVRGHLHEAANFAGDAMERLDLRLFDPQALGVLHKCAMHFIGSGLFDYGAQARAARSISAGSPGGAAEDAAHVRTVEDLEHKLCVWELQRRPTMLSKWRAPFLPHDCLKRCKWTTLDDRFGAYLPHPGLPQDLDPQKAGAAEAPPIPQVELLGGTRTCKWQLITDGESTDEDGWQYAVHFFARDSLWVPKLRCWSQVRRRRWRPDCADFKGGLGEGGSEDDEEGLDAFGENFVTTIMAQKGLAEPAGGSAKKLFDIDIGQVPIALLGESIVGQDWMDEASLMNMYFKKTGAYDLQIGPWATGAAAEKVKGKIRSVEMRVPVPPAPMCPKETRCTATWHVVVDPTRVVLESVNMSLDVPYGDSFNVVACDTFHIDGATGRTRMVRTCGVDWVKKTWMKNLVEANVPPEVTKAGQRVAEVVKRYVAAAAPGGGAAPPPPRA